MTGKTPDKRITPAGAGKTGLHATTFAENGDHPRRCGENLQKVSKSSMITGSPPQVRGKPLFIIFIERRPRITPAGAGKTTDSNSGKCAYTDHPRRCGENTWVNTTITINVGSPPQVRGKRCFNLCYNRFNRITPAGAGKTILCFDGKALF